MKGLRLARVLRGLSQQQVAERTGIGQQYLSKLERGVRVTSPERLQELFDAINATPRPDPEAQFVHDVARPVSELKTEATAIHALLDAIVTELRRGGDREALARLAEIALDRQRMILAALKARTDSLPGRAH